MKKKMAASMAIPSGLVVVDKPAGLTSHDVVARIRRIAGTRKVGHAGTLDPMATGVLVVGLEKATRLLGYLSLTEKEYRATIRLGESTSTDDAEGEIIATSPREVREDELRAAIENLTGEIMQVPPKVSAIKVGGQRAYKLTRAGAAPELAARPVTVHEFAVTAIRYVAGTSDTAASVSELRGRLAAEAPEGLFRPGEAVTAGGVAGGGPGGFTPRVYTDVDATIRCSSGTYIRSLARDLGTALGTGGHLTALRRTKVGRYGEAEARSLDSLSERLEVQPLGDAAAAAFPRRDLSSDEAKVLAHGGRLAAERIQGKQDDEGPVAAFAPDGTLIALISEDACRARPLVVFALGLFPCAVYSAR
jgi:tRNA pseudouridine55 synthase